MEFKTKLISHKKGGAYLYIPKRILDIVLSNSKNVKVKTFKGGLIVTKEETEKHSSNENFRKILEIKDEYEQKYPGFWVIIAGGKVLAKEKKLEKALVIAEEKDTTVKERIIWHVGEPVLDNIVYKRRGSAFRRVSL